MNEIDLPGFCERIWAPEAKIEYAILESVQFLNTIEYSEREPEPREDTIYFECEDFRSLVTVIRHRF